MTTPITKFAIVISGYTQDETQDTGSRRLWRKLHDDFLGTDVQVHLKRWNDDMEAMAEWIRGLSVDPENARVVVAAYSWGCGNGLVKLAHHLRNRGIDISIAVISDGVYHPPWYRPLRFIYVRWFKGMADIEMDANVLQVTWATQSGTWPSGHRITSRTIPVPHAIPMKNQSHQSMDEISWYHDTMRQQCKKHLVEVQDV